MTFEAYIDNSIKQGEVQLFQEVEAFLDDLRKILTEGGRDFPPVPVRLAQLRAELNVMYKVKTYYFNKYGANKK